MPRRLTGPRVSATERHRQALNAALEAYRENFPRAQAVEAPAGDPQTWGAATFKRYVQQIISPEEIIAWAEANKARKRVEHGVKRHAVRRRERP